jgi:hypothetical protein
MRRDGRTDRQTDTRQPWRNYWWLYPILRVRVKILVLSTEGTSICGSQNKQRVFNYAAYNYLVIIIETECVYCAVRSQSLNIIQVVFSLQNVRIFTTLIHINRHYILPTKSIYVLNLRKKTRIFPTQHELIGFCNWEKAYLLGGTDWIFK